MASRLVKTLEVRKPCGHCQGVSFSPFKYNDLSPLAPLMNGLYIGTPGSIRIAYTRSPDDRQQLDYKVDGPGTSECYWGNQKCQVNGLQPGTPYNFTVIACIKEAPERCSNPSPKLVTSTSPHSESFSDFHTWLLFCLQTIEPRSQLHKDPSAYRVCTRLSQRCPPQTEF